MVSGGASSRSSITSVAPERDSSSRKRPAGDDLALVHDRDAIAEVLGLLEIVRGVDDRGAARAQRPHGVEDVRARLRIDRDRGLVEEDQARAAHQGAPQVQPATHAAGVRRDAVVLAAVSPTASSASATCALRSWRGTP